MNRRPVEKSAIDKMTDAVREADDEGRSKPRLKSASEHPLYKALATKAHSPNRLELLRILSEWAEDDETDRPSFATWADAVLSASYQLNAERFAADVLDASSDDADAVEPARKVRRVEGPRSPSSYLVRPEGGSVPELRRKASFATMSFTDPETSESSHVGIDRRKRHKAGQKNLGTTKTVYRSYTGGTIGPLPNAFILGTLDAEYGPLFKQLVFGIQAYEREKVKAAEASGEVEMSGDEAETPKAIDDRAIAQLFLDELEGDDAFAKFPPEVAKVAHKIMAMLLYAEQSRHSIAAVAAAAAFNRVAMREEDHPSLTGAFTTGDRELRVLYGGSGGANILRGEGEETKQEERDALFLEDVGPYYQRYGREDEGLNAFVKRKTLEIMANTFPHTQAEAPHENAALAKLAGRGVPQRGADPLATMEVLGFTVQDLGGDENNCALFSLHDQLEQAGVSVGDRATFVNEVRKIAALRQGSMIDVLNHGGALLAAVQQVLAPLNGGNRIGIRLRVWSAVGTNLMEYRNVAAAAPGDEAATFDATLYFNGRDHFCSARGGAL